MTTHVFKVIDVNADAGHVTVEWDGRPDRRLTCHIPTDNDGKPLSGPAFASAILRTCRANLVLWDRLGSADFSAVRTLVGQTFDVTDEFILGGLK